MIIFSKKLKLIICISLIFADQYISYGQRHDNQINLFSSQVFSSSYFIDLVCCKESFHQSQSDNKFGQDQISLNNTKTQTLAEHALPNLVSTHHFGLFSDRQLQDFRSKAVSEIQFQFDLQSGNVFHPPIEVYLPKNPKVREILSGITWFNRNFNYENQQDTPAELMDLYIDAVFKVYRPQLKIPLTSKSEFDVGLRIFQPTRGKPWTSLLTGDQTIELFHSHIAGGEDTFGRKVYGMNQVIINYTDRARRQLTLDTNEFVFGGLSLKYAYYPTFKSFQKKNISLQFNLHSGWNHNAFQKSMDIGAGSQILKSLKIQNSRLKLGLGLNFLYKSLLGANDNIDFGNNDVLGNAQAMTQYLWPTRNGNSHAFTLHYQIQTPYFRKSEEDYFHLKGDWQAVNQGWHNAYTTLIKPQSAWSLIYSYRRPKNKYQIYIQQDLKVHNAPDIQAGFSVNFRLN